MFSFRKKKRQPKRDLGSAQPNLSPVATKRDPPASREPDAIYQNDEIVARVIEPEIDLDAKEIRFTEIYQSDRLLLPDECEFREYKIMIQRIGYATKAESSAMQKGRVLRGVITDILGYREQ